MKRFFFLLAPLLFAACSFTIDYDRYALVYGISDYDGILNDLSYSDADAVDLAALLQAQGYEVTLRTDSAATKANFLNDLASIKAAAGPEDLFLFYYAGHGGQDVQGLGDRGLENIGSDGADEWIFLHGSVSDSGIDLDLTFSDDQLAPEIAQLPSVKRVILIDACNSGGFIGSTLETDGIPQKYSGDSDSFLSGLVPAIRLFGNFSGGSADISPADALVISASGELEFSYESSAFNHGVFTYFLLETAEWGDRNRDGFVSLLEVYEYIRRSIEREWNNVFPGEYNFLPHVSGGPVDYVLFQANL